MINRLSTRFFTIETNLDEQLYIPFLNSLIIQQHLADLIDKHR